LAPGQKVTIYKEKEAQAPLNKAQTAPGNAAVSSLGVVSGAVAAASATAK